MTPDRILHEEATALAEVAVSIVPRIKAATADGTRPVYLERLERIQHDVHDDLADVAAAIAHRTGEDRVTVKSRYLVVAMSAQRQGATA